MPHVLFTAIPFVGHVTPLLHQAAELARRGWRATIAVCENMRPHVEGGAPGVAFLSLGDAPKDVAAQDELFARLSAEPSFLRGSLALAAALGELWPGMFDALTAAIAADRPDVMVVDYAATAGVDAAEQAGVPFVINNPDLLTVLPTPLLPPSDHLPLLLSERSVHDMGRWQRWMNPLRRQMGVAFQQLTTNRDANRMRRSRGLAPVDGARRLAGKLILVNGAFGLEYERPLPPFIEMVGPMLPDSVEPLGDELRGWLESGPPVVYINLGTIAAPGNALIEHVLRALDGGEFRALWVMRSSVRARLPATLPASLRVEPWVPSTVALLSHPRVRAFVSHCGVNSVHEALHAGTPIVGLPLFAAQKDMGLRVKDAGVGLLLDKNRVTADELREAIGRVAGDDTFRAHIPAIQESFRAAGGVPRAADLIATALARP